MGLFSQSVVSFDSTGNGVLLQSELRGADGIPRQRNRVVDIRVVGVPKERERAVAFIRILVGFAPQPAAGIFGLVFKEALIPLRKIW